MFRLSPKYKLGPDICHSYIPAQGQGKNGGSNCHTSELDIPGHRLPVSSNIINNLLNITLIFSFSVRPVCFACSVSLRSPSEH